MKDLFTFGTEAQNEEILGGDDILRRKFLKEKVSKETLMKKVGCFGTNYNHLKVFKIYRCFLIK